MADLNCHTTSGTIARSDKSGGKRLVIALAGNANVGKSVIFNRLTRGNQMIGNWPGKTVERAEGLLNAGGSEAVIVDLPGIYSLSTFSIEEIVTREYIANEKPDVIINVIGAPVLERNLFFTLQLIEMGVPMVVCLNQMDIAEKKGIEIDETILERILGVPVITTSALSGRGMDKLIDSAMKMAEQKTEPPHTPRFSDAVEAASAELASLIDSEQLGLQYPSRWVAIKLLEADPTIIELVGARSQNVIRVSQALARRIEVASDQPAFVAVASGRYALASQIAQDVQRQHVVKPTVSDRLDRMTTHKVLGYVTAFVVVAALLVWTFTVGTELSNLLSGAFAFFQRVDPVVSGTIVSILWNGLFGGFVAGVTLVIPYVVPFYLLLAALEDSGLLTRVAFMMDSAMHQMGLHGKAIIPIVLGFGCNVPAIYSTRIMGTKRERMLATLAITFSPCTARTIVVLGLVAAFVGIQWALALYALDLVIMFIVVKLAVKTVPGQLTGMIMEMHSFKTPSISVILRQTWGRTKSLVYMVFPIYMVSSMAVQGAYAVGLLNPVNTVLSPLTVWWLGLPAVAGMLLIFGAARKELILLMAVTVFGSNLALHLTASQLIVLALIGMLYPCFATIGAMARELGWKPAFAMIGANLAVALTVGGAAAHLLKFVL